MDDGITRPAGTSFDPFWVCVADRPDPSRAEMAMHLMAASISNHQTVADSKEDFKEEMEQLAWASTVAADALIAALARKEKQ
jgi:hypothetical protein